MQRVLKNRQKVKLGFTVWLYPDHDDGNEADCYEDDINQE